MWSSAKVNIKDQSKVKSTPGSARDKWTKCLFRKIKTSDMRCQCSWPQLVQQVHCSAPTSEKSSIWSSVSLIYKAKRWVTNENWSARRVPLEKFLKNMFSSVDWGGYKLDETKCGKEEGINERTRNWDNVDKSFSSLFLSNLERSEFLLASLPFAFMFTASLSTPVSSKDYYAAFRYASAIRSEREKFFYAFSFYWFALSNCSHFYGNSCASGGKLIGGIPV